MQKNRVKGGRAVTHFYSVAGSLLVKLGHMTLDILILLIIMTFFVKAVNTI